MKKIIILDYENSTIHIFDYDSNTFNDYIEFYIHINKLGFRFTEKTCSCMIVEDLTLQIH